MFKVTQALREYYNHFHGYDEFAERSGWIAPDAVARAALKVGLHDDANILDVGCGTGLVGKRLRELGFRGRLAGIDIASVLLREARLRSSGGMKVYDLIRLGDAYELPMELMLYDAVVSCGMLGYIGSPAFNEMVRVTRVDGFIVTTVGIDKKHRSETAPRFTSIRKRIFKLIRARRITLLQARSLHSGYTSDRNDEYYELFVLKKRA